MKNLNRTKNAQLQVPGAAPAGTESGQVVPLGPDGLLGIAETHRVTQADLDDFTNVLPQGLAAGEASFELVGIHTSMNLEVDGAVAQWAAVYYTPGPVYTANGAAAGAIKIGYALEPISGAGIAKVGLSN